MKKYFEVNCHYDMVICMSVAAENEEQAIQEAKDRADHLSIDQWGECYDHSECATEEGELTADRQAAIDRQDALINADRNSSERDQREIFLFDRQHFTAEQAKAMTREDAMRIAELPKDERTVWNYCAGSTTFEQDFNQGCITPDRYIIRMM